MLDALGQTKFDEKNGVFRHRSITQPTPIKTAERCQQHAKAVPHAAVPNEPPSGARLTPLKRTTNKRCQGHRVAVHGPITTLLWDARAQQHGLHCTSKHPTTQRDGDY